MTAAERFERLVVATGPRLLGYLARRVDPPADAADALAEVYVVAWRRLDAVPRGDEEAVRWLFGVARRVAANQRRGAVRRHELAARLRAGLEVGEAPDSGVAAEVRRALEALPEADRELLTLVAWEGLSPAEAAGVVGISAAAARKRLQRARERLGRHLGVEASAPAARAVSAGGQTGGAGSYWM